MAKFATVFGLREYQKWMKIRPRLKALDIYEIGCEMIKGSPNRICRTIQQKLMEIDEHFNQSTSFIAYLLQLRTNSPNFVG